ncbi:50S ribosomal protein L24 [Patescibacteria group bacterium]|nr:MAG: 50S ribosomal protein L24 [Patescibacteria group bacterium]
MKIKKGDKIIIITGTDKGKTGTVTTAFPKENKIIVEGLNMKKKHQKPRGNKKGQIVDRAMPFHVSNAMLVDPKTGKGTRVSIVKKGNARVRVTVKSKSEV